MQVENLLWDLLGLCNPEGRFSRGNEGFLGASDPKIDAVRRRARGLWEGFGEGYENEIENERMRKSLSRLVEGDF